MLISKPMSGFIWQIELLNIKFNKMKKLTGMKSSFSSLENKKLKNLKSIQGGTYNVKSNVDVGENCVEYDTYDSPGGKYRGRVLIGDCNV